MPDELGTSKMFTKDAGTKGGNKPKTIGEPIKSIGYVKLLDGCLRYIKPMHNLLLSYTFKDKENWKHLKDLINIYLEAYGSLGPEVDLIGDSVTVNAEYEYWVSQEEKTRRQDFRIDDTKETTYVEIQNDVKALPPILDRAVQYFGLGLGEEIGKPCNQIWLLSKSIDLLKGSPFARYKLYNELDKKPYPNSSYILFIDLKYIADVRDNSESSEISRFLLGDTSIVFSNDRTGIIAQTITENFNKLKIDKEAVKAMTSLEAMKWAGLEEGREEGTATTLNIIKLYNKGVPFEQIASTLDIPEEKVNDVINKFLED